MSKKIEPQDELDQKIISACERFGTGLSDVARAVGSPRTTVYERMKKLNLIDRPIADGSLEGVTAKHMPLPKKGQVKRYILTSAQNNTYVNEQVWANVLALKEHYDATLLVGTFSYNQNRYGQLSVKRNTRKTTGPQLWFDPNIEPYINDKRLLLAHGLVWCGEFNALPTANDPLEGLETYSHRKSAIFPHAKMAMRSIATMAGEGTKLNYTTGTVTLKNYIQKKAGLKGEHHHIYGAVIVEVDHNGNWFVRQLDADKNGDIYDLDVRASKGKVTTGHRVEAITWGDIHSACVDPGVKELSGKMLDDLKPKFQFLHDVMEGVSINHHGANNCHDRFDAFLRGYNDVTAEFRVTAEVISSYSRKGTQSVVIDSNHDGAWIDRWLREHDYRRDPLNAELFLRLQLAKYTAMRTKDSSFNILEQALRVPGNLDLDIKFLKTDESFKTCNNVIENGMHGHLGPDGARGTPANLNKVGRRANTGHTHSAGIWNGLYVAGTSSNLDMGYNKGPSSWSHSHIITYPNGKRCIVTMYNGKWRG